MLQVILVLIYRLLFQDLQSPFLRHLCIWKTLAIYTCFAVSVFMNSLMIRVFLYKGSSASLTSLNQVWMVRCVCPAPVCEQAGCSV